MRKGSKKPVDIGKNGAINILDCPQPKFINPIHDILIRICDACHEMDTKTEPWASIRKDIENLR